jgi:hypothetical protein
MSDGGKGSSPRPFSVPKEIYDKNFEHIFRKNKNSQESRVDPSVENVYNDERLVSNLDKQSPM